LGQGYNLKKSTGLMDLMRLPCDVRRHIVRPFLSSWIVEVALPNALVRVADFLDVTADDVPHKDLRRVFASACKGGHTATAKWLVDAFALTAVDARANKNYALCWACDGGHLATAQWLAGRFGLVPADARDGNGALQYASRRGHTPTARWLASHFALVADDARADNNRALRQACADGHLETMRWLVDTFALTADDARANDNNALRWAKRNGHVDIVDWLENFVGAGQ
jgi:ankyrin repeat protein